jgi:hypothetical protein
MIKRKKEYILIGNDCSVVGGAGIGNNRETFHSKKKNSRGKRKISLFSF